MVFKPRSEIWKYFDNYAEEGVAVCKICKQRLKNERSYSLKKHLKSLHNPKTDLWKYYLNIAKEGVAECKICKKRIKNNRSFNLSVHLKKHDIIIVDENVITSKPAEHALKLSKKESLCILMEEKILVDAVMGLMIDEGVVPQLFSSKNMQALLNPLCDAISKNEDKKICIGEEQSEHVIHSVAGFIRKELANEFHSRLLTLRIDMHLRATLKIYRVSVQFFNETQIENRVLDEIYLEDGEELSGECIENILRKFSIDTQQIVNAYWDNTKAKFGLSVSNFEYLEQIQEFEMNPNISVGEVKLERYIGVIAQLCFLDVLKNPVIFKLFLECRNLTKFINVKPAIFGEAFKQNNLNIPQLDSPWRWGSTYNMMSDLKNAFCILDNLKYEPSESVEDRFNFNENLKDFINAFCEALKSLQTCLQNFYTTEMIYGDFYCQWLKCKLFTEKLHMSYIEDNAFHTLISSELVKSFEKRSNEFLNQNTFKACLYLDPRFQRTLSMPEKMLAVEYLEQLWHRAKLYNKKLFDPVPEPLSCNSPVQSQKMDDDDDVLNEFLSKGVLARNSMVIYKKLEELKLSFQTVEINVVMFWKELKFYEPEIHTLVAICFAIPATQNYNKIMCLNIQPSIYTKSMSTELKDDFSFIRFNKQLLGNVDGKLNLFREDNKSDIEIIEWQDASRGSLTTNVINEAGTSLRT